MGYERLRFVEIKVAAYNHAGTYIVFNAELPGIDVALVGLGSPGMFHRKTLKGVACLVQQCAYDLPYSHSNRDILCDTIYPL